MSGHAARHISKSSSNAREGQSNCQASHEPKKDAQFQDSHYLDSLLEVRAARHTETVLLNSSKSPDPIAIRVPLQPLHALAREFGNCWRIIALDLTFEFVAWNSVEPFDVILAV